VFRDLTEPVLQVIQPLPQDKQALLRHLEKTSPETLALARDWDDIARSVVKAGEKLKKCVYTSFSFLALYLIQHVEWSLKNPMQ
jgi:U3 small nucleolar RNA-associated protein 3